MSPLLKFFLFTFLITWTCFIIAGILPANQPPAAGYSVLQQALLLLGTIAPSLVALWISNRDKSHGGIKNLLNRVVKWQVHFKWYLFAAGFMVMVKLSVALIYRIIEGDWPIFGQEAWYILIIATIFSTPVQAGEEIGWRGFALPRMSEKIGLPASSLLLGILWAVWHLPLFFIAGTDKVGQSFPLFLTQVVLMSVILAWLYFRTKGSLLLTMLMHSAINNTKDIVPSVVPGSKDPLGLSKSLVAWLSVILFAVVAVIFLFQMRRIKTIPT